MSRMISKPSGTPKRTSKKSAKIPMNFDEDEFADHFPFDDNDTFNSGEKNKKKTPKKSTPSKKQMLSSVENEESDFDDEESDFDDEEFEINIGFIDVGLRSYICQNDDGREFVDECGEKYVLDKSGKGYFDEKRNHFIFDDSQLQNRKTPESRKLIKKHFIDDYEPKSIAVSHPIKRMLLVSSSDFNVDSDDDSFLDELELSDYGSDDMEEMDDEDLLRKLTKKPPPPTDRRGKMTAQKVGKASSGRIIKEEKKVQESHPFQAGDEKYDTDFYQLQNADDAVRPKMVPLIPFIKPKVDVHRNLAKLITTLSEDDLNEVFLYIEEKGGRLSLNQFTKLLHDHQKEHVMNRTENETALKENVSTIKETESTPKEKESTPKEKKSTPKEKKSTPKQKVRKEKSESYRFAGFNYDVVKESDIYRVE